MRSGLPMAAVLVLFAAFACAAPAGIAAAHAPVHPFLCHTNEACRPSHHAPGHATPPQTPAGDLRSLVTAARFVSAPCFNGFTAVRRDLSALSQGELASLTADAQADQQACLRGVHVLQSGIIPHSLQRNAQLGDFVTHLRNALAETAHACADAIQVAASVRANNVAAANAAVIDFGRAVRQQTADTNAAAGDLLRLQAAFHL